MKAATFLLAGAALILSACSSNSDDNEPPQQATAAHVQPHVVMSSVAEANCANAGGDTGVLKSAGRNAHRDVPVS